MELLLSYIEFQQFEDYIKSLIDDPDESKTKTTTLTFPESVPSSEIINTHTTESDVSIGNDKDCVLRDAKIKAHKIFNKYIKCGCQYEINIEYKQRQKLTVLLGDLDALMVYNVNLLDLKSLFAECKNEMFTLLTWSLGRFKTKKEYQGMIKAAGFSNPHNHQISISLSKIEKD